MYGYNGKLLFVDLDKRTFAAEEPGENFYRQYAGNGIMGAYFLLDKTPAGIDALAPENLLMFFSGAVNGQTGPGLARFTVCGKSPVTGGIGEARSEGPFAIALKESGFDGIIISGKLSEPGFLLLQNGEASLLPAGDLWGEKTSTTTDALAARFPGAQVAAIGPAGEKLVRFANIISGKCHQASRSGMGAVMGSKNLKALVIAGGELPAIADPAALKGIEDDFRKRMKHNPLAMWQYERPGFGVWIHTHGIDASVCVNNYQSASCTYLDKFKPEFFDPFYRGVAACPGCALDCIKTYSVDEHSAPSGGLHQEIGGSMGPNIGNDSAETVIKANVLCNEYGMDPNALGYVISFAQELAQRGLLDPQGLDLGFKSDNDALLLLEMIANRTGLGDLLAEGSARAAASMGAEAAKYAMTVKGNEMVAFEPRSQTNLALGYATGPIGPRYEVCEHDWDFDTRVGWEHTLDFCRTLGIRDRIPMDYLGLDKVRNYKVLSTLWSAVDALGVCLFASAPTRVLSLRDLAKLVAAITGWETSDYEIMRWGEMRLTMFRLYNCREGLTADDDMLPDRFFDEAIDFGLHKGVALDRATFQSCIRMYYAMMGWDEAGMPSEAALRDFGLDWAVPVLDELLN